MDHLRRLRHLAKTHAALLADQLWSRLLNIAYGAAITGLILICFGMMTLIGGWFLVSGLAEGLELLLGHSWMARAVTGAFFMFAPVIGVVIFTRMRRQSHLRQLKNRYRDLIDPPSPGASGATTV